MNNLFNIKFPKKIQKFILILKLFQILFFSFFFFFLANSGISTIGPYYIN